MYDSRFLGLPTTEEDLVGDEHPDSDEESKQKHALGSPATPSSGPSLSFLSWAIRGSD